MPVELTHVGEAVVASMVDAMRWKFVDLCGLASDADRDFLGSKNTKAVYVNSQMARFDGRSFDGASRIDLVLRIRDALAVAFELKLGTERLTKARIDSEWLCGCKTSHKGKRWAGNMMSILERNFPPSPTNEVLKARLDGADVPIARDWFIVARSSVIQTWDGADAPSFSRHVHFVSFEDIVSRFGGKEPFNEMVGKLLDIDYYSSWVESS